MREERTTEKMFVYAINERPQQQDFMSDPKNSLNGGDERRPMEQVLLGRLNKMDVKRG